MENLINEKLNAKAISLYVSCTDTNSFLGKMQFVRHELLFRLLFLIYKMLPVYICHSGRFLQRIAVIAVTQIFAHLY